MNWIADCFVAVFFHNVNSCSLQLDVWAIPNILDQLDCGLFCQEHMCTMSVYSWWKILAWGSWNFKHAQILLINWMQIVLSGMHGALSVLIRMEISCQRQIDLCLSQYLWWTGFQIVLLACSVCTVYFRL